MSDIHFGEVQGIKEGQKFESRKALIEAGLHRSIQHGIDGNGNEGVAAIVVSGGNDATTKKQIANQSWDSHGNKGLKVSQYKKLPVRVIRGAHSESKFAPKAGYAYGGLYQVIESWDKIGRSGFAVCLFKLKKIEALNNDEGSTIKEGVLVLLEPTGLEPKWFSIGVDAPKEVQKLSISGALAQNLIDKNIGDSIHFGNGFKVLEIKKYLSI
jgi:hypothetical protein